MISYCGLREDRKQSTEHKAVPGAETIAVCNPRSYHENLGSSVCVMVDAEICSFLTVALYSLELSAEQRALLCFMEEKTSRVGLPWPRREEWHR